ncbi:MAG: hypothetical protein WD231_05045 [Candidatus Woykebacteria bacterium]
MAKFEFRENQLTHDWVILAPQRAKRPDVAKGTEPTCPFCYGAESKTPKEVFRVGSGKPNKPGWIVRVVPNKFAFAPIHEIIIHSPIHHDDFFSYSPEHTARIIRVYKARFLEHSDKGQVYIFHNHGQGAAESLPHSHTQLTVVSNEVILDVPRMGTPENVFGRTKYFSLFCPSSSQWPYEVWVAPVERGRQFGDIREEEIKDLSKNLLKVLRKLQKNLGADFSFNFYIYHGGDWYLRLIPRVKVPGGFELGTGIFVNTVDPAFAAKRLK